MTLPSISEVEKLYDLKPTMYCIKFSDRKLAVINREISELLGVLGDQKELSIWPQIIATLKKVRFDLATLPVPPVNIITSQLIEQLNTKLPICEVSFPDNLAQLSQIINSLQNFQGQENRFLSWIQAKCIHEYGNDSLCILSSRYINLVENLISTDEKLSFPFLRVTSPRELKDFTFFSRIFFCGSISLFSENQFRNLEYVWRSPRAPELYFLSYDWIRDDFEPKPVFDIGPDNVPISIVTLEEDNTIIENTDSRESNNNFIDIEEINFSPVEFIKSGLSSNAGWSYEFICECRLLAFEDGTLIYKEIDQSSRVVELDQHIEIHKIPNKKLEPGMLLVVRTEGSGDSIAAVADMLFGENAEKIRAMQDEWKDAFRRKLTNFDSIYQVAGILTGLGAPTANETNVRNWQRHDTIKPKDKEDFKAIMVFSESSDMIDKYWENARKIVQMHIKAGKEISKLLLSRINNSSIENLKKYGRIDIKLKGLAGKMSVISIESIMPNIYNVPSGQLDKLMHIEREF
jgi:hypothetical protein